jgi:hypothetical protein
MDPTRHAILAIRGRLIPRFFRADVIKKITVLLILNLGVIFRATTTKQKHFTLHEKLDFFERINAKIKTQGL